MAISRRHRNTGTPATTRPVSNVPQTVDGQGWCGVMPVGIVLHGMQGIGKTALAANFPNVGFVVSRKEKGIDDLVMSRQVPQPVFVERFDEGYDLQRNPPWQQLIDLNYNICGRAGEVETVWFDSLTFIQTVGFRRDCKDNYDNNFGKEGYFAFQTGPKSFAQSGWTDLLDSFEAIKDAGITVGLIAHTTIKPYSPPGELAYDRYIPDLDKEIWSKTFAWAQLVLFYKFEAQIQAMSKKPNQNRGRVVGGSQTRMIYTQRTEAFDAKERWGMDGAIDAGHSGKEAYDNLEAAFVKCFQ